MLILECSQGCYGRTDGSVSISLRNFFGEGIIRQEEFEETKGVIRIINRKIENAMVKRKSTNNDLQSIHIQLKI
jgi:hypothetical protein